MENQIRAFLNTIERGEYSVNTLEAYSIDLKQFLDFAKNKLHASVKISEICPELLNKYWIYLQRMNYKENTLQRKSSAVKAFIKFLDNIEMIQNKEILLETNWPKTCSTNNAVIFLRKSDLVKVFSLFENIENPRALRDFAIINTLLDSGLMISDLIKINLKDWGSEKDLLVWHNRRQESILHLRSQSIDSIRNYLKFGRPDLTQNSEEKALFVSQWGTRISRQGIWQILSKWGKEADLKVKLTPRILRNTAIKNMIDQGKTSCDIQSILGHKNSLSTQYLLQRFTN